MKELYLKTLQFILKKLSQWTIARFKPTVVGVTGSVGKTSTKSAIATVLGCKHKIRQSQDSHNNAYGIPLAILGEWSNADLKLVSKLEPVGAKRLAKLFFWMKVIILGILKIIIPFKYPEVLVLEYGIDRPGDMKYLLEIAKPDIAVITAIGTVPVHVEFFHEPEDVAREKGKIVEGMSVSNHAIFNADDVVVMGLEEKTRAKVMTYGFDEHTSVRLTNYELREEDGNPAGISFKMENEGNFVPVRIDGVFGRGQAYSAGAAGAVGIIMGMNLVEISESLSSYKPPPHRMQLLRGIKDSHLIDDSYNASPLSMEEALRVMEDLPGKRRVGILGDMLEIGKYSINAHKKIGQRAANVLDVLVAIGPRAKFIADAAREEGMPEKNIFEFEEPSDEAIDAVEHAIHKGDLVIVKASRAVGLEKVVEAVRAR